MRKTYWWAGALGLAAIAIGVLVWTLAGTSDDARPRVRIGYKANSGYQNYFIAMENGYFARRGVEVEGVPFESTNLMIQALIAGDIDATPASSIEVLALSEQNAPDLANIFLTLVFDQENAFHSLLVPQTSPIRSIQDLRGKAVGVVPGSTTQSWLRMIVARFFDPAEMRIVQLEPRLQLQAMLGGQVDALYTVDPVVTTALVKGQARLLIEGPENQYLVDTMAAGGGAISRRFVTRDPEAAQRLILALYDAADFMRSNPAESRRIIAKHTGLDPAVANAMDLLHYWKLQETDYNKVQAYLDLLLRAGIISEPVRAQDLYLPRIPSN